MGPSSIRRTVVLVVCLMAVAVGIGTAVLNVLAGREFDAAVREARGIGNARDVYDRYAPRPASNAAAKNVDSAALALGLSILPRSEHEVEPLHDRWAAPPSAELREEMHEYIRAVGTSERNDLPEAPETVTAFLETNARQIEAVEQLLITAGPGDFALEVEEPVEAPIPNISGILVLTRVLAIRSLATGARGSTAAWRSLEAAWRLNEGLARQPWLVCKLVLIADLRLIATAARRLDAPAPEWFDELTRFDNRGAATDGLLADPQLATVVRPDYIGLEGSGPAYVVDSIVRRITWPFRRPRELHTAAFYLRGLARAIEYARSTDPCEFDAERFSSEAEKDAPAWLGKTLEIPNLAESFARGNRVALDLEGTERILAVKGRTGSETAVSAVCRGRQWTVSVDESGSTRVEFNGAMRSAQPKSGFTLATAHVIPPGVGASGAKP